MPLANINPEIDVELGVNPDSVPAPESASNIASYRK
jgi:hypothetical protein